MELNRIQTTYNMKREALRNNNINIKCNNIIKVIENMINNQPIYINFFTYILIY